MSKLQAVGDPIERLNGNIITLKLQIRIQTKQTFLQSDLYLAVGAEVVIKSNLMDIRRAKKWC